MSEKQQKRQEQKERWAKWFASFRRVLRESLTNNWHIKLISLGLAFIVWPVMMLYINPLRTRTVEGVVLKPEGLDYFNNERKLAIVESLSELPKTVDVEISVRQEERHKLSRATVTAVIDFSRITEEGTQQVPIDPRTENGTIVKCDPAYVTVTVERRVSRSVPVKVREVTPLPDGYKEITQPTVYPSNVTIWGAESVVSDVRSALVDMDKTMFADYGSYNYSIPMEVFFVNENDEPVNADSLSVPDGTSVNVSGRVLPTAIKPILFGDSDFIGMPASGYALHFGEDDPYAGQATALDEDSVLIAAPQDVLGEIEHLTLAEPINVDGKKESFRDTVSIRVPSGVEWMQRGEVGVYCDIYEIMETRAFDNIDLEVRGLKEGMKALFNEGITVRVLVEAGQQYEIDKLNHEDIVAYLDVSDRNTSGIYEVNVGIEIAKLPAYIADPDIKTVLVSITPEGT
jgi:YbbR domain-containing protein